MEAVALMDSLEHPEICLRSAYQSYKDVLGRIFCHSANAVAEDLETPLNQILSRLRFALAVRHG